MDDISLFKFLPTLSVKSLRRVRDFIDTLIEIKTPEDRQFISSLDINDFVKIEKDFVSDTKCLELMNDFKQVSDLKTSGKL